MRSSVDRLGIIGGDCVTLSASRQLDIGNVSNQAGSDNKRVTGVRKELKEREEEKKVSEVGLLEREK